jgi:ribonucleotide reductase beta subunit family protein with ferritin-like domain
MAIVERPAGSSATDAVSYPDLYARWERGNWAATEIDLTQDAIDWREKLTAEQRRSALWLYTLFFHGEDSVADNLSPYVDAAPTEEQTYFLTTQQVDEARHAVFFHRFMHEVVGLGGDDVSSTLAATQAQLPWGHRKVFSRLDEMARELRADQSKLQLAKAVTLYHVIVEASMAQPGQHMIEDSLERYDILPGFRAGMRNIALDEQRHIGFGIKLLADLYDELGAPVADAIAEVLREVLPWTAAVAMPPGWDRSYTECFGFTLEDLGEEGARSLEQKLRAIGLPVEEMRIPMDWDLTPRDRAMRGMQMVRAHMLGPDGPVDRAPANVEVMFDSIARSADATVVRPGTTIAWDFTDFEPWHLVVRPGSTQAARGRAADADLSLRCTFDDWVGVVAGRRDPRRLLLTRRLRVHGDLRLLLKLQRVFD